LATRKAAAATAEPVDDGLVEIAEDIFKDDRVDTDWDSGGLIERIARITASLPDLQPKGENKFFNYRFITDKQVLGILRPRLSRAKILIVPEHVEEYAFVEMTTQKGGTSHLTKIRVDWRVMCATGSEAESFPMQSLGYGDDSGDKGANKAFTAAFKNVLLKLFEIGGESDDLEADEEADKRAKARESGARQVTEAVIGKAEVENVERGGKASRATEAQIARVGQYVRDLSFSADAFAAFVKKKMGLAISLGDKPWDDVRRFLEGMGGEHIGELIAHLDELLNAVSSEEAIRDDPSGYGA